MGESRWTRREHGARETRTPSTYDRRYFETTPMTAHVPALLAARREIANAVSGNLDERNRMKRAQQAISNARGLLDALVPARERVKEAMEIETAVRAGRPAAPSPSRSTDERLTAARSALNVKNGRHHG